MDDFRIIARTKAYIYQLLNEICAQPMFRCMHSTPGLLFGCSVNVNSYFTESEQIMHEIVCSVAISNGFWSMHAKNPFPIERQYLIHIHMNHVLTKCVRFIVCSFVARAAVLCIEAQTLS